MVESSSQSQWLSVAEAARALRITETAVRKRIRSGLLPARGDRGSTEVQVQVDDSVNVGTQLDHEWLATEARIEAARLAGTVAELRARLADAQQDRDRWHLAALEAREEAHAAKAARDAVERELRMALART